MTSNIISAKKIVLSAFLFMLIFNPPLVRGLDFVKVSAAIALMYIVLNFKKFESFINQPRVKSALSFFLIYIIYGFGVNIVWALIRSSDLEHSNLNLSEGVSLVTTYLLLFIPVIAICMYSEKNRIDFIGVLECLLIAFSCQAILAIIAYISPDIKSSFVELIYRNSGNSYIAKIVQGSSTRRVYGLASNLWDHFGGACAIMFGVCVCMFQHGNNKRIINAALIVFMVYLNSRTALLTCLTLIVITLCYQFKNRFSVGTVIKLFISFSFFYTAFQFISSSISGTTSDWVSDAFDNIKIFFSDNREESSLNSYFNDFVFFSDDYIATIFGQGLRPRDIIGKNSDIGYIEIIWRYGIIGSIMLYVSYFNLIKKARSDNKMYNQIVFYILIVLAIFHMKINILGVNSTTIVANTVIFSLLAYSSEKEEPKIKQCR